MGLRKVMGQPWMGRPASRRRSEVRPDRSFQAPLLPLRGPSGHPCSRGQQRTQSVQGPRQTPGPCHLSGQPLAGSLSCLALAGTSPSCSCVCLPRAPLGRSTFPPHAPPGLSPPSHRFFLTLLLDAQGQEELGGEAGRDQGHSGGCREGAWTVWEAGTARRSRLVAPGPGCSSCGQPDGPVPRAPWSKPPRCSVLPWADH